MIVFLILVGFFVFIGFGNYQKKGNLYPVLFLSQKHRSHLASHFEFYQKLPNKSKDLFAKRVAQFIGSKRFIPRQITHVSDEMKVLISASAVQLTFGFNGVHLSYFKNILVYPDSYYSTINRTYHKGEVNPKLKAIVISWKAFTSGYALPDGKNLGLHEMAHALRFENRMMRRKFRFLHEHTLIEWELRAQHTMQEIREGREDFFREYGAENQEEFFAVAVENFFERPKLFSTKHALTYKTLSRLLQQDPLLLENT